MAGEAGAGCAARTAFQSNYTFVSEGAPASTGGSCNGITWWARSSAAIDCAFAFFTAAGNNLTTVSGTRVAINHNFGETAGCHSFSAPGDFTAVTVSSGNYVGVYVATAGAGYGIHYGATGASGLWNISGGDYTNVSGQAFTLWAAGYDSISADITAGGGSAVPAIMLQMDQFGGGEFIQ